MDQVKIGLFIRECRKAKGLTQEELANILHVLPKTISKWETGHGTPDVANMYPLCDALGISLNELFLGKRIEDKSLLEKQNETLLLEIYMKEKEKNRRTLIGEVILGVCLLIATVGLILIGGLIEMETYLRVIIIVSAMVMLAAGLIGLAILDLHTGYFECPECHERFVPSFSAYLVAMHTLNKRHLKCPHCGKTSWCIKRLSSKDE